MPKQKLLPSWDMPSDPVKALWWFMHWLLQVLVRYLWLPIAVLVVYEVIANARIGGIGSGLVVGVITLGISLIVWAVLYLILLVVNFLTKVRHVVSDMHETQQQMYQNPFDNVSSFSSYQRKASRDGNVVEGSISEVDDEKKRSS
ncbi:MAG TPA: hypothetical protein VHZ51_30340 [Ktedonobacteraceae bacterium]|jgi:hypothetical protein|nr:hypothetical protein [Ktedonobacteraceae bacterium]